MYVLDASKGKSIKFLGTYTCTCITYNMENMSWTFDEGWTMEKATSHSQH